MAESVNLYLPLICLSEFVPTHICRYVLHEALLPPRLLECNEQRLLSSYHWPDGGD